VVPVGLLRFRQSRLRRALRFPGHAASPPCAVMRLSSIRRRYPKGLASRRDFQSPAVSSRRCAGRARRKRESGDRPYGDVGFPSWGRFPIARRFLGVLCGAGEAQARKREIAPTDYFGFHRRGDFQSPAVPSECCAGRAIRRSPLRITLVSIVGAISNRPPVPRGIARGGRGASAEAGDRPYGDVGFPS